MTVCLLLRRWKANIWQHITDPVRQQLSLGSEATVTRGRSLWRVEHACLVWLKVPGINTHRTGICAAERSWGPPSKPQ